MGIVISYQNGCCETPIVGQTKSSFISRKAYSTQQVAYSVPQQYCSAPQQYYYQQSCCY